MSARNDEELFGRDEDPTVVMRGVAGWDDSDDHIFLGTDVADGVTLVKVQLFKGKPTNVAPKPGQAQGHKIMAQVTGPLYLPPPKGQVVLVAFPEGHIEAPGAGVIMCWLGKSPAQQFNKTRAMIDMGPNIDLVFKARSVTLTDYGDNNDGAQPRIICIGPPPTGGQPGIMFQDETGSGGIIQRGTVGWFSATGSPPDAKSVMQMTATEFSMLQKEPGGKISFVRMKGGNINTFGTANQMIGGGCYIGAAPTAVNFALWGPTGVSGAASPSVFLSPT